MLVDHCQSFNVLIVDDDIPAVEGIRWMIEQLYGQDIAVQTADSMSQAQQILDRQSTDILITDIQMPKGSGLDLLSWARNRRLRLEAIMLTSYAEFEYANQAIKLQSMDYLLKPVSQRTLAGSIDRALREVCKKRAQQNDEVLARYWLDFELMRTRQFYANIILEIIPPDSDCIKSSAEEMHVDFSVSERFLPIVLTSVSGEQVPRSELDNSIRTIGKQTVFPKSPPYLISCDRHHLVVLDRSESTLAERRADLITRCLELVEQCNAKADLKLLGCAGEYVSSDGLSAEVFRLIEVLSAEGIETAGSVVDASSANSEQTSIIDKVNRYIRARFSEELSRDEIARHVYLNPEYLSRLYKRRTGCSLTEYISRTRITEAKSLLRTSNASIGEIAFKVGFSSWSYFARVFRKETGLTPGQYREGPKQ